MVVDSISAGVARLEDSDGRFFTVPSDWLPAEAREGSVLLVRRAEESGLARVELLLDEGGEKRRRTAIRGKLDALRRRDSP